ncbi:MAG: hypothetical protein LUF31_07190, partial [Fusobacterium sp.]|nr:hypothetical protein [Fusobacterium sp.]
NKVFEDTTRKKEEKINEYKPCIENLETELQKIISIQKANGNSSSSGQSKMFNIDKTKEEIKELEKASTFQTILDNYERAMEKAPKVWDLLGLDD